MRTTLHRIGNSRGLILPKSLLTQLGLTQGEVDLTVERDAIVLRKPKRAVRVGWADAAKRLAAKGDDALVWPEFPNKDDSKLKW